MVQVMQEVFSLEFIIRKINYEITYQGKIYPSIAQLAEKLGILRGTLSQRIKDGWPEEKWGDHMNGRPVRA